MTTNLCVAPEDVMALLDGELSATDAHVIEAHLAECGQCALLAKQLRGTSTLLSQWSVPSAAETMDSLIKSRAQERGLRLQKRWMRIPPARLSLAGALTAVLAGIVVVAISLTGYQRARMVSFEPPSRDVAMESPTLPEQAVTKTRRVSPPNLASMLTSVSNGVMDSAGSDIPRSPMPMVARVMSMTVVVKDVDSARTALDSIVARHHGYSAQESVSTPKYELHSVQASLRVPASELTSAAAEIAKLGQIVNESQTGEEVSQMHADLVARLKTARETEARFQAILHQRTGKVSEVLEVEQNIARLRRDIEGMEAEQKGLEHRVVFTTIDVNLSQEYKAPLQPQADSSSTQLHNASVEGYRNVTGLLFGIVLLIVAFGPSLLVCLVILGVPAFLLWRRYQKIRSRV